MLKINYFVKKYDDQTLINHFNLTYSLTGLYHLEGLNGSGKTTLFNCISGFDDDFNGSITYNENHLTANQRIKMVHYMFQDYVLFEEMTGLEHVKLFFNMERLKFDSNQMMYYIDLLNLTEIINEKINSYSVGQKRKVQFLHALITRKRIILLDEPFNQIDDESKEIMVLLLQTLAKEKLVIYTNHEISDLKSKLEINNNKRLFQTGTKKCIVFLNLFKKNMILFLMLFLTMFIGLTIFLTFKTTNQYDKNHIARKFYDNLNYAILETDKPTSNAHIDYGIYMGIAAYDFEFYHGIILSSSDINKLKLYDGTYPNRDEEILVAYEFLVSLTDQLGVLNISDYIGKDIIINQETKTIVGITQKILIEEIFIDNQYQRFFEDSNPYVFMFNLETLNSEQVQLVMNHELTKISSQKLVNTGKLFKEFSSELSQNSNISDNVITIVIILVVAVVVMMTLIYFNKNILNIQKFILLGMNKNRTIFDMVCVLFIPQILSLILSLSISNILVQVRYEDISKFMLLNFNPYKITLSSIFIECIPIIISLLLLSVMIVKRFKKTIILKVNIDD